GRGDEAVRAALAGNVVGALDAERRGDPHLVRRPGDVLGTNVETELREDDVNRVPGRLRERIHAAARLGVVDGPGGASIIDLERLRRGAVVERRVGVDP